MLKDQKNLIKDIFQESSTANLTYISSTGQVKLVANEDFTLSGIQFLNLSAQYISKEIQIYWHFQEGNFIFKDQVIATLKGPTSCMLKLERMSLHLLRYLSGIATLTKKMSCEIEDKNCKLLSTYKLNSKLEVFENEAISHGGGLPNINSNSILLHEGHLIGGDSMQNLIQKTKQCNRTYRIEVSMKDIEDIRVAVNLKVDKIIFKNKSAEDISQILKIIPPYIETQAHIKSRAELVKPMSKLGVDIIAVDNLSQAPWIDCSFVFEQGSQA